jgi:ADP-ribose pyrophosphatase YjhB (NUDIX family)
MSVEHYEEVDSNDVPTGRLLTYEQAHGLEKPPHRVAAVFVTTKDGRLIVQHHWSGKLDHSVGGHVDAGETYERAAYREMKEELGIENVQLTKVAESVYCDEGAHVHVFGVFTCSAPESWNFQPNDEVREVSYMTLDELGKLMDQHGAKMFTKGFTSMFKVFRESL